MTNNGWSKSYEINVSFFSGEELNNETNTLDYLSLKTYAVIFWDKDQVSIIELKNNICRGLDYNENCTYDDFHNRFEYLGYVEGLDQEEKEWKICFNSDCS